MKAKNTQSNQLSLFDFIENVKDVKTRTIHKGTADGKALYITLKSPNCFQSNCYPTTFRLVVKSAKKIYFCSRTFHLTFSERQRYFDKDYQGLGWLRNSFDFGDLRNAFTRAFATFESVAETGVWDD